MFATKPYPTAHFSAVRINRGARAGNALAALCLIMALASAGLTGIGMGAVLVPLIQQAGADAADRDYAASHALVEAGR